MKAFITKYSLLIAAVVLIAGGVWWSYHAAYKRGWNAAMEQVQKQEQEQKAKQQAAAAKQQDKQNKISQSYQTAKAESDKKSEVRYVEVQKVVERPVYINKCLDDDGVQLINKAIGNN